MSDFSDAFGYPAFDKIPKADAYDMLAEFTSSVAANASTMARLERGVTPSLGIDKEKCKEAINSGLAAIFLLATTADKHAFDYFDDYLAQLITDYHISALLDRAEKDGTSVMWPPFIINLLRGQLTMQAKAELKKKHDKTTEPPYVHVNPMTEKDVESMLHDVIERFGKGVKPFPSSPEDKSE